MGTSVATQVLLPKLGFAMVEGMIVEWLISDGARVKEGDFIYTIESDKVTQEVEAPATGTIRILATEGQMYQVGDLVAEIL